MLRKFLGDNCSTSRQSRVAFVQGRSASRIQILNQDDASSEASEHLRGLVSKIVLTPKDGEDSLPIDLYGDLVEILTMVAGAKEIKNISH